MENSLLEPVLGVTLQDYAVVSAKMATGIDANEICRALGIDPATYEEASAVWAARMQEDETMKVVSLFGQYFGDADSHPKLGGLRAEICQEGLDNLEKIKTDRYLFEEINGAREAAYDYGLDGAEWVQENFGISLGDFQIASMQWASVLNGETAEKTLHYMEYRQQMHDRYADQFAAAQGGDIADDVEF